MVGLGGFLEVGAVGFWGRGEGGGGRVLGSCGGMRGGGGEGGRGGCK